MKTYAPNRRQFLRHAVTAAGAAGISLPIISSARGADSPAPSDKITIGCIGVGGMGTGNMKVFVGLPGCRVVAVCDAYEDRRQRAKSIVDDNYGNQDCKMYGDFRELLARQDIDAVMIAPQDHWHSLVATAAVKAGKDMYCEKPLGVCVEDGRRIRDAVRGAKRVFQTGTWQRSQGKFKQAVRIGPPRLPGQNPHGRSRLAVRQVPPQLQRVAGPAAGPGRFQLGDVARAGANKAVQSGPRGLARLVPDLGLLCGLHRELGRTPSGHRQLGLPATGHRTVSRSNARSCTARKDSRTIRTPGVRCSTTPAGSSWSTRTTRN